MKILIATGHSVKGRDKGAISHNGETEGQLNYDLAYAIKEYLINNYVNILVDVKEEKNSNAEFSIYNRKGYDVAISIHHNSFNLTSTGAEVLYKEDKNKELALELTEALSKCLKIKNRGIKQETNLYMLNIGFDVLIEPCFISNPSDYGGNYNKNKIAEVIAKKIGVKYNMIEKEKIVGKGEFLFNGTEIELNRILHNEKNYIELRELEKLDIKVSWDNINKIPIIEI